MQRSTARVRTSHVGRLPSPKGWEDMPARLVSAGITDPPVIAAQVTRAIAEIVKRQVEVRINCIGAGEFWTARSLAHYTPLQRHRGAPRSTGRAADHPSLDPRARRISRFLCRHGPPERSSWCPARSRCHRSPRASSPAAQSNRGGGTYLPIARHLLRFLRTIRLF